MPCCEHTIYARVFNGYKVRGTHNMIQVKTHPHREREYTVWEYQLSASPLFLRPTVESVLYSPRARSAENANSLCGAQAGKQLYLKLHGAHRLDRLENHPVIPGTGLA